MSTSIKTTCPYCGVGCGIEAVVDRERRSLAIHGDAGHPANFGRLCSKGSALGDTVGLEGRLLYPRINGRASGWNEALDAVAGAFRRIIDRHGPDAVALYGSGQLLTEDYYVANKLMKGFIGSANIDTNSRLCMSSSVAGHKRAFGSDTVPGCYDDLELAELIVLVGSNAAWCHPVSFQRIRAAKNANPALKIVVIDPRRTATCDIADLHLPLASGSDAALFNGLLHYLHREGRVDRDFVNRHTDDFQAALSAASGYSVARAAGECGLAVEAVERFYRWFGDTEKAMTLYSQGVNQSSSGTDKVNAVINCHLATGRIGRPGSGPFSLTGQPNAMGGREVGGLAHQLAAHMEFEKEADIDRVARFWGSTRTARKPGYSAVDLFDAIYDGRVKAVWIMGTNPVVSLPNADKAIAALQRCEFVAVSDCIAETDTAAFAHVLLPAAGWSEKDGTVTNSERRISRQRALFTPAGEAKPDWWIVCEVAKRLGFDKAFDFKNPAEIFREHAALSGFENDDGHGRRDFDISAFSAIDRASYDALQPVQWPVNAEYPEGRARVFDDGGFFTSTRKARFIAVQPNPPAHTPDSRYPLILNTGRIRDQWHTMTRTALAPRLNQHRPEPFVEVHQRDVKRYGLETNGLATVESAWGSLVARVRVTDTLASGQVFVPMHWTRQYSGRARIGALVNPVVDPISKQPESKHTPVRVRPFRAAWYGFLLTRREEAFEDADYWAKIRGDSIYRYELAGSQIPPVWQDWLKARLSGADDDAAWLEYEDADQGHYRAALMSAAGLEWVWMAGPEPHLPDRGWLTSLFAQGILGAEERSVLLTGRPPSGDTEAGPIVCACFNVGEKAIRKAVSEKGLKTVREVGACLKAGTNCGSCVPEIKALL